MMKKFLTYAVAFSFLSLSAIGCGDTTKDVKKTEVKKTDETKKDGTGEKKTETKTEETKTEKKP